MFSLLFKLLPQRVSFSSSLAFRNTLERNLNIPDLSYGSVRSTKHRNVKVFCVAAATRSQRRRRHRHRRQRQRHVFLGIANFVCFPVVFCFFRFFVFLILGQQPKPEKWHRNPEWAPLGF